MGKYDLIVVGGGPAGLVAAKTAAEDGLRVVLIEKKRDLIEVNRTCGEMLGRYVKATPTGDAVGMEIRLEIGFGINASHRILLPELDLAYQYRGILRPYYNYLHYAPSGGWISRYPLDHDEPWGFHYRKELLLASLKEAAERAGVEIRTGTSCTGAMNDTDTVTVRIRSRGCESIITAKRGIAADGVNSTVVESLGLNKTRKVLSPITKFFAYYLDGIEAEHGHDSFLSFAVPSINPYASLWIGLHGKHGHYVGTTTMGSLSPQAATDRLMRLPAFAGWFRNASITRKTAGTAIVRTPITEPVAGNFVIVGDAAAPIETYIPEAGACGYLAAKAVARNLESNQDYTKYVDWWQRSFEFNQPDYFRYVSRYFSLNKLCSDEDIDDLYRIMRGKVGVPSVLIADNLDLVKREKPELYSVLREQIDRQDLNVENLWSEQKKS